MTHEQVEEVAQAAATLYGQVWSSLPQWSKDIWKENVRHIQPGVIRSEAERCAVAAVEQWHQKQAEPEAVQTVEKKTKNKK